MYGVSIKEAGQIQEDVLMSRNACYATTQDLHTTDNIYCDCVPDKIYIDVV